MTEIRRLRPGDEERASEVATFFKSSNISDAEARNFLSNSQNHLIVAEVNGELAGFLLGYALHRVDSSRSMMFLYEIDVAEQFQRRGVGRALVEELDRTCREQGFLKMFVLTNESNLPAVSLYQTTGGRRGEDDEALFVYRYE
ncbi:MAG: GNAT family N-acetyltransferase [Pyrinomonadaceae bacterium]